MRRALLILVALVAPVVGAGLAPGVAAADSSRGPIVRFATSLGNIDVQLLSQYAPNTVTNFLRYVNSGAYATTFFHRSAQSLGVIQGGSYDVVNGQRQSIPTNAPIPLEYNLPNARGTLAMARTNSSTTATATSGWFFNNTDNSSEWAPSSATAGYAVFGQVLDPTSLKVMDAIAAEPVFNDTVDGSQYAQLPVRGYGSGAITPSNLIMSPITVLNDAAPTITINQPTSGELFTQGYNTTPRFSCSAAAGSTAAASCTSTVLDTSTPGEKTFTVTATDYAGNSVSQSVPYTVNPAPPAPTPIVTPLPPTPHSAPKPPTLTGSLIVARSGKLPLALRCTTSARCSGTVSLNTVGAHHRTVRLAFTGYRISGRRSATLTLRLGPTIRKRLAAHHRLAITVVLTPTGGTRHTLHTQLRVAAR